MKRRVTGLLLTITGILVCPCHLPLTLPLLASLLAGTALGAALLQQRHLLVALATLYFLGALIIGGRLLLWEGRRPACPSALLPVYPTGASSDQGQGDRSHSRGADVPLQGSSTRVQRALWRKEASEQ